MIRQLVAKGLQRLAATVSGIPTAPTGWHGTSIPHSYHLSAQVAYEKSIFVQQAVSGILLDVSKVKPVVKEWDGERYLDTPPQLPLNQLLLMPNNELSLTFSDLIVGIIGHLLLEGNCFLYLTGPASKPTALQPLPASYMTIHFVPNTQKVARYEYQVPGGKSYDLPPETIIHFKNWHPRYPNWGLSQLSAAMIEIDGDYQMAQWNQQFFGPKNAVPNLAVEIQGSLNDSEFDKLQEDWLKAGGRNRGTMFFRSGAGFNKTVIHDIGLTPLEISFLEGRKFNRQAILELFGIPLALKDPNTTEAASLTGEREYYEMIFARLNLIADRLTLELATFFGPAGQYRIGFEDVRPVNRELEMRERESLAPFLSINEMRAKIGLPPVDWGEAPSQGAGSAIYQFGGMDTRDHWEANRTHNNDPDGPAEEEPDVEPGRQARGVLKKADVVKAQRRVLDAWGKEDKAAKAWNPLSFTFDDLPEYHAKYLRIALPGVATRQDIELVFNPLFDQLKGKPVWVDRQLRKLPPRNRRLVQQGADEIMGGFGFDDQLEQLEDIPDELWEVPDAEL